MRLLLVAKHFKCCSKNTLLKGDLIFRNSNSLVRSCLIIPGMWNIYSLEQLDLKSSLILKSASVESSIFLLHLVHCILIQGYKLITKKLEMKKKKIKLLKFSLIPFLKTKPWPHHHCHGIRSNSIVRQHLIFSNKNLNVFVRYGTAVNNGQS